MSIPEGSESQAFTQMARAACFFVAGGHESLDDSLVRRVRNERGEERAEDEDPDRLDGEVGRDGNRRKEFTVAGRGLSALGDRTWNELAEGAPEARWIHYNTPRGHVRMLGAEYRKARAAASGFLEDDGRTRSPYQPLPAGDVERLAADFRNYWSEELAAERFSANR